VKRYGQYCPVARAAEVLAERWTLLVIRELLWGNERFTAIARGVPRMSPSLLSTRLRELRRAGLVTREVVDGEPRYRLTEAGRELDKLVEGLGAWGQRWMQEFREDEYDPALLMLDIARERSLDTARLPAGPEVVELRFTDVPERHERWWLTFARTGVEVGETDPGVAPRAWLETDPGTLTRVWMGDLSWAAALREELLRVKGDVAASRAVPTWIGVSRFAKVESAAASLPRT
jgi:DNA-binding HxlR family transcriptional regulator